MSSEEALCLPQSKRKEYSTLSTAHIEDQAKELSASLFIGVKTLLQRSYDEAEAQLSSYQDAANKEIAETETLINALQERNIQLLKDKQSLQELIMQAKETEYNLQKTIQADAQEKNTLNEENRALLQRIDSLKNDITHHQATAERLNTYNQTIQTEHHAFVSELHQQHIEKINELQDFFEASMQSAKETHQKDMERKTRLFQEEKEQRETEFQHLLQQANNERTKAINENIHLQKEIGEQRVSHAHIVQSMSEDYDRKWDEATRHSTAKVAGLESSLSKATQKIDQMQQTITQERLAADRDKETFSREAKIKIEGLEFLLSQERSAHAQEKQDILRQSQLKVERAEQQLSLEKDDKKNLLVKAEENIHAQREALSRNMKHSAMNFINKEKAALIQQHEAAMATIKKSFDKHVAAVKADAEQKMHLLESKLQAMPAASERESQLEKELSILAQKKYTVELHFKKLQKETVELKRIISTLRKQHSS